MITPFTLILISWLLVNLLVAVILMPVKVRR